MHYLRQRDGSGTGICIRPCNVRGRMQKGIGIGGKWVYSADNTMQMPYKDNLQSLIHERVSVSRLIIIHGGSCRLL